jgi:hypothetical protein
MAILAPADLIASLRRPKTVFTENYLNDPIRFPPDERFYPVSALRQLGEYTVVERDNAEFPVVDLNATGSQYYAVTMVSPTFKRDVVRKLYLSKKLTDAE